MTLSVLNVGSTGIRPRMECRELVEVQQKVKLQRDVGVQVFSGRCVKSSCARTTDRPQECCSFGPKTPRRRIKKRCCALRRAGSGRLRRRSTEMVGTR